MNIDLRTAREKRGWDRQTLAKAAGVANSTVGRIESGEIINPSSWTVACLEQALGLRRGTLLFGPVMEKAS